jgi:hypothetical protein
MKYSAIKKSRWEWTYDDLGSESYNVLGALECALINLSFLTRSSQCWTMDEMERYSYRFTNQTNYLKPSSIPGFLEPVDEAKNDIYWNKKR